MQETTSCLFVVPVTVTVVCVSFSHYVDETISIMGNRGSHCKQHVCERERRTQKEGDVGEGWRGRRS